MKAKCRYRQERRVEDADAGYDDRRKHMPGETGYHLCPRRAPPTSLEL
jgi:hypothetical protein